MDSRRAAILTACLFVVVSLSAKGCLAADPNSNVTMNINGNSCATFNFQNLNQSFSYNAQVNSLVATVCNQSLIT